MILLDNEDPLNPTVLVKLYDPLPEEYDINSTLWIVTNVEEPLAYDINFVNDPIEIDDFISIQGPNFNIPIKDQVNNSTLELSYNDLISQKDDYYIDDDFDSIGIYYTTISAQEEALKLKSYICPIKSVNVYV